MREAAVPFEGLSESAKADDLPAAGRERSVHLAKRDDGVPSKGIAALRF